MPHFIKQPMNHFWETIRSKNDSMYACCLQDLCLPTSPKSTPGVGNQGEVPSSEKEEEVDQSRARVLCFVRGIVGSVAGPGF